MWLIHWFRWLVYVQWVSLDTHSASIQRPFQLNATIAPSNATNKNLVWTSSNTNIATVDNNWLVIPVWEGNCTITVMADWHSDSCTFSVSPIRVTWVTLDKNSILVNVWETEQLTAIINPSDASNHNVTWSSSNTSIATVSSTWLVTAIWDGTVTITVTTQDWWYTATCSAECSSFTPIDCCFWYTWAEQSITLQPHEYCLEVWWASWWYNNYCWKWWYSSWCITIPSETTVYIYVWWCWWYWSWAAWWRNWWWISWTYWGNNPSWWWWWASDIRIWGNTLYHRRIVAGWGWGWWHNHAYDYWWVWWWICWEKWKNYSWWTTTYYTIQATQTSWASFWNWTNWYSWTTWWWGGWWWYWWGWTCWEWWSWWSWYVYTSSTCSSTPSWYYHCTAYFLANAYTCCWLVSFPSPSWSTETWHSWCGCVRIRSL